MNLIYINHIDDIVRVHDKVIEISGGLSGLKDIGYLESVIYQITNDDYYPEFEDKLTHLVFSINKFHAFQDGNKRTSIAVGAQFLELNGFDYVVGRLLKKWKILLFVWRME
ncbi:type II toxin-antitoxin system death-on-curing family toxin [Sphingobacterium thalpophilum]|uniref:type II toxin-antitoxin system death-on-curing family toxin n=1 Tax=Sphingobacterium thalpophilum TaxID=259 RepID=UPI003C749412